MNSDVFTMTVLLVDYVEVMSYDHSALSSVIIVQKKRSSHINNESTNVNLSY